VIKWLRNWWWARQRAIDLRILWPECKAQAEDLDHAKAAFAVHAFHDNAWIEFYGAESLIQFIDKELV
jgi:hypothetical protein